MPFYFYMDPTYLLLIPALLLSLFAQWYVNSTYKRYANVPTIGGQTAAQVARDILDQNGLSNVQVERVSGHLTDHYDPTHKRLVLSSENYRGTSLAALGVAAHEAGHAIQHKTGYAMLQARMALVPITQISSRILPFVIFGAFIFRGFGGIMLDIGILCYAVLTLFHLITLPVEFDASRRAKVELAGLGIIAPDEEKGVSETLNAAALTYVAAFLGSLINLLWLLSARRN